MSKKKPRKRYSAAEKKAYYMGIGYAIGRDTANNSNDVKFFGGEKSYNSFVGGISKMNDLDFNFGKEGLGKVFNSKRRK